MTTTTTPEFTTAIRGYDRLQVEEHVERLERLAAEAEERAHAAEAELEVVRHTTVGPRVGEILELAVTEAKEIQDRAHAEARRVVEKARSESEETVAKAREREAESRARLEAEREEAEAQLEKTRRFAEIEIAELKDAKGALIEELTGIQNALASITGSTTADGRAHLRPAPEPAELPEAEAANG